MQAGVYRFLGIEVTERTRVLYLVVQSVFLGVFYGAFDIGAHALFLETFGPSMLPKAFLISGLAGMLLTTVYSHFQKRISFARLSVYNLLVIAFFSVLIRVGFPLVPEKELIFFFFVMMGPLNIIALLGFWGTAGRIFSLRQGKRLFGLVDLGQVLGVILSSYAIPVILTIGFRPRDTLIISSASILVALGFQIAIGKKFNLEDGTEKTREKTKKTTGWVRQVIQEKYILYMALFVVLSMITAFFVHYSFLAVTNEQYTSANEVANFLGLFNGSMMIFIVLIKTFVYSRLLKTYGLRVALALSSVLLGIFTVAAVITGSLFGYTIASASFTMFFLAIAMSKLFSKSLKDSIEAPSFKILYQSLDPSVRHDIQARIDGTINELAAVSSGIILTILGALPFFRLIHFSIALLGILIVWFFVALALYSSYRRSLDKTLARYRQSDTAEHTMPGRRDTRRELIGALSGFGEDYMLKRLEFASGIHAAATHEWLGKYLAECSPEKREKALGFVKQYYTVDPPGEYIPLLENRPEPGSYSAGWLENLERLTACSYSDEDVITLTRDKQAANRQLAVALMRTGERHDFRKALLGAFRDTDPKVVREAIYTASVKAELAALPSLAEFLGNPEFAPDAFDAFCRFGTKALDTLEQTYYKAQASRTLKTNIIRIYNQLEGEKVIPLLLEKASENDLQLAGEAVKGLHRFGFQASGMPRNRISQILEKLIGIVAWNFAARSSIGPDYSDSEVTTALDEEISGNMDFIYHLLSILYESKTIAHIRENIESGSSEGVGFAMELLDQLISEEMKPVLIPVLDDLLPDEKYRQLEEYLPLKQMEFPDLLTAMINRDYSSLTNWTKACALEAHRLLEEWNVSNDLLAQLFNPDPLLRQSSALLVRDKDPLLLEQVLERGEEHADDILEEMDRMANGEILSGYNIVLALKELEKLRGLPGSRLSHLAMNFKEVTRTEFNHSFLTDPIQFLARGKLHILPAGEAGTSLTAWALSTRWERPLNESLEVKPEGDTLLMSINQRDLKHLLFNYPALAEVLMFDRRV